MSVYASIPPEITVEITIVIPVYNGSNYLRDAIDSVLNQSYRDFEILVVDDGSKDDTWSIIESYMAEYPGRVRGIRKQNGGIASALNAGILDAKGKYFAWLSHDDRFLPDKLEKQMQMLREKPEIVGVYTDYSHIDAHGQTIRYVRSAWYPLAQKLRYLLWRCFINGSTLLIERRCLIEMGLFDTKLRYAQDVMMWGHLVMHYELGYIPEPLTDYRIHEVQTSQHTKLEAIRRDDTAWRRKALSDYSIQEIFPELAHADVTPRDLAIAYCDLGRLFTGYLHESALGYEQYRLAWQAWPSLRNPVLIQVVQTSIRLVLRTLRNGLRTLIQQAQKSFPWLPQRKAVDNVSADFDLPALFQKFKFATAENGSVGKSH